MQGKIIQRVVDEMAVNSVIDIEDKGLYVYGLQQGLFMLLNILTIIIIGKIFGMLWQSVVFMITYIPLRTYAGGYHARTQLQCYISSVLLIVAVLLGIKFIPWTNFICITISIVSGLIIYILSPVEDMNKPLDAAEVKVYKKKARSILILEIIGLLILTILRFENVVACMSISLLILNLMLIYGRILK